MLKLTELLIPIILLVLISCLLFCWNLNITKELNDLKEDYESLKNRLNIK